MADFTTNLSSTILASGAGPVTLWGTMVWNVDPWLGPDPIPLTVAFARTIAESVGIADTRTLTATFYRLISEGSTVSEALDKALTKVLGNTITGSTGREIGLKRGIWSVLFPGEVADSTERSIPTFTETTIPTTTWTSSTATTPTWTEL